MSAPALLESERACSTGRVLAAHSVWLDEADLAIVAEHDVAVAHCPGSNGKLGAGVAPLPAPARARRAGRPRHRRPGLQRRPPPVGRDAAGRTAGARHRGRSRRRELGRWRCGWPPAAAGRHSAYRSARSRWAAPPTSSACAPTTPASPPRSTDAELLGHLVWAGAGLPGDRRLGGRRRASSRPAACTLIDAERARAEVGQRARRLLCLLGFPPCPDSSTRPSCTRAPATGERGRCRGGARRTWTGAVPTAATAATAATCGSWPSVNESSLLGFRDHPFRRATDGVHGSGSQASRRPRQGPRGARPGGHRRAGQRRPAGLRPGHRAAPASWWPRVGRVAGATRGSCPTGAGRPPSPSRGRRAQECWLDMELKLMADVALVGLPQRGEVDADLDRLRGQAEDRGLPLHHAGAASRRGPGRGSARRHRVRDGRHPRSGRGRGRRQGPGPPVPAPHRAGAGARGAARPRRPSWAATPPSTSCASCCPSSAPTGPSSSTVPGCWSGSKADVAADDEGVLRDGALGRHRRGGPAAGRRGWPRSCTRRGARGGRVASSEVVVHRPAPEGVDVERGRRRRLASSWAGPPSGRWPSPTSPTPARRPRRCAACAASASTAPWPGPACRDGDEVTVGTMTFTWGDGLRDRRGQGGIVFRDAPTRWPGSAASSRRPAGPATRWWSSPRAPSPPVGPRSAAASSGRRTRRCCRRSRPSASTA